MTQNIDIMQITSQLGPFDMKSEHKIHLVQSMATFLQN